MMPEVIPEALSYSAAFLLGLVGSPHCVAMCGGIAGLLGASSTAAPVQRAPEHVLQHHPQHLSQHHSSVLIAKSKSSNSLQSIYYSLLFQLGRISSYAFLGAILGGSVATADSLAAAHLMPISQALRILASVMLIIMALSVAGWSRIAMMLEKLGGRVWQKLQPVSKRFIPVDSPAKAISIGGLWGFLPCGLIYSALAWSALSGSAIQSAILMACFGLGTAPAVLSIGSLSGGLRCALKKPLTRYGFAGLLTVLALYPLYTMLIHKSAHQPNSEHNHSAIHQ
ncbi:MAG: sulfite exporter TauE/SafE family protein [Zhongshania sp.]|uniref:sulfite exporter TauE/SafE family protein n=1 Tax=Zhongshania sp. TaxID=1971902 RepID=UPI0026317D4C|nr:sulfite exporter TauE/SafE family protein [Zhongshania sp.]MDF1691695.1 sulfite exporter TauE/SafE family protein [Zhongshania sp.]